MKEIDYYKNNEILENSYYQIPQELFINKLYKEKLISKIETNKRLVQDFELFAFAKIFKVSADEFNTENQ